MKLLLNKYYHIKIQYILAFHINLYCLKDYHFITILQYQRKKLFIKPNIFTMTKTLDRYWVRNIPFNFPAETNSFVPVSATRQRLASGCQRRIVKRLNCHSPVTRSSNSVDMSRFCAHSRMIRDGATRFYEMVLTKLASIPHDVRTQKTNMDVFVAIRTPNPPPLPKEIVDGARFKLRKK